MKFRYSKKTGLIRRYGRHIDIGVHDHAGIIGSAAGFLRVAVRLSRIPAAGDLHVQIIITIRRTTTVTTGRRQGRIGPDTGYICRLGRIVTKIRPDSISGYNLITIGITRGIFTIGIIIATIIIGIIPNLIIGSRTIAIGDLYISGVSLPAIIGVYPYFNRFIAVYIVCIHRGADQHISDSAAANLVGYVVSSQLLSSGYICAHVV
jgi:hypothetical protein